MKKLWIILLVIALVLSMGFDVIVAITSNRFIVKQVDKYEGIHDWTDSRLYITKDKQTGVCYLIFEGVRKGGITVMYDSKGNILIEK